MKVFTSFLFILSFVIGNPVFAEELPFCSQASQDKFVYSLLYGLSGKKDEGYYLEIGAGDPQEINNSYFFEKKYGWKGVSIDINPEIESKWHKMRNNPLVSEDATQVDYTSLLASFLERPAFLPSSLSRKF